ncbi:aromatic ring-hydroxylating oxygenase subunit alpha [Sphingobium subterraneum]|uniref:Phenylpropionate dioxygenase-like ring-hydroxylating dioxygenase large terminal subunit n=1 Tax=Sphingobium subterraneum TaxID=627688 RepID=A0A841IZX0_9SPHN|nr:Rieske 2Fe-2S domain-containing protein [Sphingobium subterraneum]MBB6124223.1 phenylpropionate dioxygenase-like ring-hydroxylating dioxygenase large terminal subunit [Sphingobium subterraneum]
MNEAATFTESARKRHLDFDLGPGAHQCWYPMALSPDVPVGKVIGADLADGRIVLYRGEDGTVRAMSAYCRHMGADLSAGGDVVGNDIRCPYHHWAYGDGGVCNTIPSGDRVPRGSNLVHLPTQEQFGLIWVFLGETPLYDLQTFKSFDPDKHVYRSFQVQMEDKLKVEPWVFTTNVFDIVHLRFLHGMDIAGTEIEEVSPYLRRMYWIATHSGEKDEGELRLGIDVFGANSVRTEGEMNGRLHWYISASTPFGPGDTRFFFTVITTKGDGQEDFLDSSQALATRLINEDLPVLNNMRFGTPRLVASDNALGKFIRAAREYPRTTLDALETAANRPKATTTIAD